MSGSCKLTGADVIAIRARHAAGARLCDIAADYPQVSTVAVHKIVHGRTWRHVALAGHAGGDAVPATAPSPGESGDLSRRADRA